MPKTHDCIVSNTKLLQGTRPGASAAGSDGRREPKLSAQVETVKLGRIQPGGGRIYDEGFSIDDVFNEELSVAVFETLLAELSNWLERR